MRGSFETWRRPLRTLIRGGQDGGAPEAHPAPGVVYAMLLQPKSVSIDVGGVNTDAL
jgi:hypothetical protein